uniref:Nuclear receptor domain-containing protein n=1 Tax=Caenorhabditis tropicalis TaxID=1561998 RepID=A0A1I7UEK6_9PELO
MEKEKCKICDRDSNAFHYGVCDFFKFSAKHVLQANCCNACKMFFRRVITFKTPLKACSLKEECFDGATKNFGCRLCRFQKCVTAGMIHNQETITLSTTLVLLSQMEFDKRDTLENRQSFKEITFEEATDVAPVKFILKSSGQVFDCSDWERMHQITIIDYLKRHNISRMLTAADLKAFLKGSYVYSAILSLAMHDYSLKSGFIKFPEGVDVLPKEMSVILAAKSELEIGIKCRLIGRLAELQVTNEEFLFLSMIFVCNPAVAGISKSGAILLSSYQQLYSNLLFKYCQTTHQNLAPTRFTDLLSLSHVVAKTKQDIASAVLLLKFYKPDFGFRKFSKAQLNVC